MGSRLVSSTLRLYAPDMTKAPTVTAPAHPWGHDDFDSFRDHFDADPFHRMLGITVVERSPGFGRIRLAKTASTPGGIGGSVHGGVLASMVDIAMLVAVFADLRPGEQPAGTAELGITYLRQAQGSEIFADARVIKRGRQLAMIEVEITDGEGRLCAKGRTLYAFRAGSASQGTSERTDSPTG